MVELKTVAINTTILLMFLNAGPALLSASGVAEDLGINPSISGDQTVEEANEDIRSVEPTGGFAGTLFQLYNSVTQPVKTVLNIVTAGPTMLISVGVPAWLVGFIFVPQYMIVGGTIIYVLAGRLL